MTVTDFVDQPAPEWPAAVVVEGIGGEVKLWATRGNARAWFAQTHEYATHERTAVAWTRPRGRAATYSCAVHGAGHRRNYCPHVEAATVAADVYEKETR